MKQVFRLLGMPDRLIAFDELPKEYLEGLELFDCSKLPRQWREFIGLREKYIKIPPDRDPFTGQMHTYTPVIEKAPFVYLIDWELNHDKERWGEIESYIRRTAPKDFRLLDKIADMAKPMARDAHSELDLEPEDVVIIPLPKIEVEEPVQTTVRADPSAIRCDKCDKEFASKQAVRMHKMKKHAESVAA